ncbi:hypothetical protein WDV85_09680 [Pseudokineococcus sp. 5B2Z-1]|uniref:hypothetical protein n=1 Tax=Pseudokineococcus sp. 5B2Z-1 TaxID=3132744 RepID=UPI003096DE6E
MTSVDLNKTAGPRFDTGDQMAVSALLELELDDGRRVVLLDDRGWSSRGRGVWAHTSLEDLTDTARMVVGPDEPPDGVSYQEEAALHWGELASRARSSGVDVDGNDLIALPHDVDISTEVRARVARGRR